MRQIGTLRKRRSMVAGLLSRARLLNTQELLLVVAVGVASAAIGQLLGRPVRAALGLPLSGSIAAALPRAVILLIILARTNRFGALTVAGLSEVIAKFGFGAGGLFPWALVVPVIGGLMGDVVWAGLKSLPGRRVRLVLSGGALCGVRVLAAMVFLILAGAPIQKASGQAAMLWGIVGANVVLGMIGGLIAAGIAGRHKPEKTAR